MKQCEIITTTNWKLKTHKTILGHKNDRMALAKDVTRHGLHTMAHITAFKLWHIQRNSYYGPQQRFQKIAVVTEWISPNITWPIKRVSKYGSYHVLQNMTLMNTFTNSGQKKHTFPFVLNTLYASLILKRGSAAEAVALK